MREKLPEKWRITRNLPEDQIKIVSDYINNRFNCLFACSTSRDSDYFINELSNKVDYGMHFEDKTVNSRELKTNYTEITFEEFKHLALKEMRKYTISEVLDNKNIFVICNKEQHSVLQNLSEGNLCDFYNSKDIIAYSVKRTWIWEDQTQGKQIIIRFEDIDLKEIMKEIIGYIVPFDINSVILKGDILTEDLKNNYCKKEVRGCGSQYYLKGELVRTWEPIYKEEAPELPIIEGYRGELVGTRTYIKYGCGTIPVRALRILYDALLAFNTQSKHLHSFVLDKGEKVTGTQLQQIIGYLDYHKL